MATDDWGGVALEELPKDDWGGVAVVDQKDDWGGIAVDNTEPATAQVNQFNAATSAVLNAAVGPGSIVQANAALDVSKQQQALEAAQAGQDLVNLATGTGSIVQGNAMRDATYIPEVPFDPSAEPKISATPTFSDEFVKGVKDPTVRGTYEHLKKAGSIAYEAARRPLTPLLGPTESERVEKSIPVKDDKGNLTYQYKPYGNRLEREAGLMTPFLKMEPMAPEEGDSAGTAVLKSAFNTAQGLVGSVLSPGGAMLPGGVVLKTASKVAGGLFAVDMMTHVPEQLEQMVNGGTLQQRIEGGLGAATSLAFGFLGGKHALSRERVPDAVLPDYVRQELQKLTPPEVPLTKESQFIPAETLDGLHIARERLREGFENQPPEIQAQRQELIDSIDDQLLRADKTAVQESEVRTAERGLSKPVASEATQALPEETPASTGRSSLFEQARREEPAPTEEVAPELSAEIDPGIAKVVSESAERIADQVTKDQPTAVREAARDAALNNAMSSLRNGKSHNISFMRKSAQQAAGEALKKQGESLDAPVGEGETTKLDQETAPTTVSNEELYKPLNDVLGSALSKRDASIVRAVQERSMEEVAAEHGLSKQRVSQIVKESLPKLRKALEEAGYTKDDYAGGPGAMGPVEALEQKLGATGTNNAAMQAEREARGEDPLVKEESVTNRQAIDEAVGVLLEQPERGEVLAKELINSTRDVRTISAADEAILMAHKVELRKQRTEQEQIYGDGTKSPEEHAISKQKLDEIEAKMNEVDQATFASGAEWGRMGQLRQRMIREDYSLENMESRARRTKGDALTDEEKATIKAQSDKIQELTDKLEKVEQSEKKAIEAADEAVKELNARIDPAEKYAPRVLALAESIVTRLDSAADKARQRIRDRLKNASAGLDPTVVYDVAVIGTSKLARASLDFAKWSAEMTKDLGDWVKPYLEDAWKESEKMWTAEEKKLGGSKSDVSKVRKTKADAQSSSTTVAETIASRAKSGDSPNDVSALVQKLALDFVRSGIKDREPLVTAVHDVLKESFPNLTRESARDLISGYGEFKALDKEAAKVTLRGLKGEMQQVAKIEDMQAKQAPKKTGIERRTPTDEERRLQKEVNELKKKGGFDVVDPEKQLKTAMDAVKTRLNNEIRDLDTAIATQERLPSKKNVLQYDAEAKALKERRDAKRAEYDELFPKEPLTEEQQIDRAGKALDRSISQLESDLKSGKLYGEKNTRKLTSPELEAKRSRLEALRAERDELRSLDTENLEKRALQQFKTRTTNRIAEIQEKLANQDFSKKVKREIKLDPEATKLKFEIEKVKEQYNKELVRIQNSNQSLFRKALRSTAEIANLQRAIFTGFDLSAVLNQGGFIIQGAAAHPVQAFRALKSMVTAIKSEQGKFEVMEDIRNRPNYPLYEKAKLFLADSTKASLNKAEEAYMARWIEKMELSTQEGLKGAAKRVAQRSVNTLLAPVRASERAYTGFLNQLRAETFDRIATGLESKGKPLGLDDFKAIANFVNVATGRGGFGKFENAGQALSTLFFSPRFVMSRFGLLTGEPIRNATSATRGAIAKEYGNYLGAVAAFYALGAAAGGTIEVDPRSTDFGKLKFGKTRIDPLVGIGQVTTFLTRMITGETKRGDQIIPLRETGHPLDYLREKGILKERVGRQGQKDAGDVAAQFARSKLAPVPGATLSGLKGKDFMGKKTDFLKEFGKIIAPMSSQSVLDTMKQNGIPEGIAISILQILGARINQYEDKPQR